MKALTDLDPMPYGMHAGTPMQDVPARYLHWFWTTAKKDDYEDPVACYIRENLEALKQEHPDGIW